MSRKVLQQALKTLKRAQENFEDSWIDAIVDTIVVIEAELDHIPDAGKMVGPISLETVYEIILQWDEGGGKRSRRELARRILAIYDAHGIKEQS